MAADVWCPADDVSLFVPARCLLRPEADTVAALEVIGAVSPPPQKPSLRLETTRSICDTMGGGGGGRGGGGGPPEGVNGDCCDK